MRRLALVVVVAALSMGQMCGTAEPQPQYDRLDVTPNLLQACDWMNEQEIEETLFATEQMRIAGLTYEHQLAAARAGCTQEWCDTCAEALIAQVYGR